MHPKSQSQKKKTVKKIDRHQLSRKSHKISPKTKWRLNKTRYLKNRGKK